jgi:threonine/homoserine/homoserine lactone efflux protein
VTLKHSLLHSRRAGIWSAVGVAGGNLVHVVLSLLGLAVIISQSVLLLSTMKWFGAAYLVYLGLKSLKTGTYEATGPAQPGGANGSGGKGAARVLRSSFLVSTLNPKVTLFYLVLFTQVVESGTTASVRVLYGLRAVALSFGWYALVALLVSHGRSRTGFGRWRTGSSGRRERCWSRWGSSWPSRGRAAKPGPDRSSLRPPGRRRPGP